jgi:hypothetical protein
MNHPHAASAAGVLRLVFYLKNLNLGWGIDMTISILGIDIAKNTFRLHGAENICNSGSQTLCIASSATSSATPKSECN